ISWQRLQRTPGEGATMSIYQTEQGFGVDYRDEFGKRHRRLVGSEEAARHMDRHLREKSSQTRTALSTLAAGETLTLEEAKQIFLANHGGMPATRSRENYVLTRLIARLGNIPAARVTPQLLATDQELRR